MPSPDRVAAACDAPRHGLSGRGPRSAATACDWDWPDRWVQVRASNTEPIARVIAEAPDAAVAEASSGGGDGDL